LIGQLGGMDHYWLAIADWVEESLNPVTPYGQDNWQDLLDARERDAACRPSSALLFAHRKIIALLNAYSTLTHMRILTNRKNAQGGRGVSKYSKKRSTIDPAKLLQKIDTLQATRHHRLSNTQLALMLQRSGEPYRHYAIRTLRRLISQENLAGMRRLAK
jgi:hypothetical protein